MKDLIKILYVPSLNIPVVFWRIENYARTLFNEFNGKRCFVNVELEGLFNPARGIAWDKHIYDIPQDSDNAQAKLKSAFKFFDVIIFQKIQNLEGLEYICKLKKLYPSTKIYAEVDDSIGEIVPSSAVAHAFKDHHNVAGEHCAQMDGVICSTEYLAESVKRFNKNTFVAPNCISKDLFKYEKKTQNNEVFTIGYVAGGGHDEDLLIAYKAIKPLLDDLCVKFVIRYGGYRPSFLEDHKNIDFKSWNVHIGEYAQKVADLNIDLNIIPLRDTEFNRCKSNLKLLESTSMGIPAVVSNVGPYRMDNYPKGIYPTSNDISDFRQVLIKAIASKSPVSETLKYWCFKQYDIKKQCSLLLDYLYSQQKL